MPRSLPPVWKGPSGPIPTRAELGLDKSDDDKGPATKPQPKEDLKLGASNEDDEVADPKKVADEILKSAF